MIPDRLSFLRRKWAISSGTLAVAACATISTGMLVKPLAENQTAIRTLLQENNIPDAEQKRVSIAAHRDQCSTLPPSDQKPCEAVKDLMQSQMRRLTPWSF